jgi:hypothetical protein
MYTVRGFPPFVGPSGSRSRTAALFETTMLPSQ